MRHSGAMYVEQSAVRNVQRVKYMLKKSLKTGTESASVGHHYGVNDLTI